MAGLIDSIRDQIAEGDHKDTNEASDNVQQTLEIATKKMLHKVSNGEVDLDVKDIKDLAAVASLLNQNGNDEGATGTPQAPDEMVSVFSDEVPVQKTPDGEEEIDQDDLLNLSKEDIDKLAKNQFNKQNEVNYQANEA